MASVYGELRGLTEAFVIERLYGPKIRTTIKTNVKSRIRSKIKPKPKVGVGEVVEGGSKSSTGVLDNANYAQKTFGNTFSAKGREIYSNLVGEPINMIDDLINAIDRTGIELYEEMLSGQLSRNKLTSEGISTVRPSGGQ